jgi:hypothetical protein
MPRPTTVTTPTLVAQRPPSRDSLQGIAGSPVAALWSEDGAQILRGRIRTDYQFIDG